MVFVFLALQGSATKRLITTSISAHMFWEVEFISMHQTNIIDGKTLVKFISTSVRLLFQYLAAHVFLRTSSSAFATLLMDPSVMMKTCRG